jgi:hypothetical protein
MYCAFWLCLWPHHADHTHSIVFTPEDRDSRASLASVLRHFLGDLPAFLSIQVQCEQCGLHKLGLVPRRPSRTRWMLQAAARVSELSPFLLCSSTDSHAVCSILNFITMPFSAHPGPLSADSAQLPLEGALQSCLRLVHMFPGMTACIWGISMPPWAALMVQTPALKTQLWTASKTLLLTIFTTDLAIYEGVASSWPLAVGPQCPATVRVM